MLLKPNHLAGVYASFPLVLILGTAIYSDRRLTYCGTPLVFEGTGLDADAPFSKRERRT